MSKEGDNSKLYSGSTLFIIVFLFLFVRIFQGIDVIDDGVHLNNIVAAFTSRADVSTFEPTSFLSNYIGGAWLAIAGEPNLLWARLGGVLIYALNAPIVFHILSDYFNRKKAFYAVLVSTLLITIFEYNLLIHYYTVPGLLFSIWLLFLHELLKTTPNRADFKSYGLLLGFLLVPIVLSRFTLILIALLPIPVAAYYMYTKNDPAKLKAASIYAAYGAVVGIILFAVFYHSLGFLGGYVSDMFSTVFSLLGIEKIIYGYSQNSTSQLLSVIDSAHTISFLQHIYTRDISYMITGMLFTSMTLFNLTQLSTFIGKKKADALVMVTTAVFVMFMSQQPGNVLDPLAEFVLVVTFAAATVLFAIFFYTDRGKNENLTLLMISGLFIMWITPVGTGTSIAKALHGMWLILPLCILKAYELRDSTNKKWLKSSLQFLDTILVSVVIISLFFHAINDFRDDVNRLSLNTEFKYKYLRGVYSTPQRVAVLDEMLSFVNNHTERGDVILDVDTPITYYLTETKPFFGKTCLLYYSLEALKTKSKLKIESGIRPKLFIYSKANTESRNWPNTNESKSIIHEYFRDEYVNNLDYTLVLENEAYAIYERGDG